MLSASPKTRRNRFTSLSQAVDRSPATLVYELPKLSIPQILQCLQEMKLNVTESDLVHPTPHRTQQLFECLLGMLSPWRVRSVKRIMDAIAQDTNHWELRQDFVSLMTLFQEMKKLLTECCFTDFTLEDMANPTQARLLSILSALINYAKFREQSWEIFEPLALEADELELEVNQLATENEEIEQRLEKYQEIQKQEEPELREMEAENAVLEGNLRNIRKVADRLLSELNQRKQLRHELKDAMSNTQYSILTAQGEIERLNGRLKSHPDDIRANVAKLRQYIESEEANVKGHTSAIESLNAQTGMIRTFKEIATPCLNALRELEEQISEYTRLKEMQTKQQQEIEKKEAELSKMRQEEAALRRGVTTVESKIGMIYAQQQKKRETVQLQQSKNEKEAESARQELAVSEETVAKYKASIKELETKIGQMKAAFDRDSQHFNEILVELEQTIHQVLNHTNEFLEKAERDSPRSSLHL
ncbi:Nuf2 family-domain-containing protein [Radiomyces spectabilis]|uniref:Nuf2 family-domain-containing protein n=1 Tax=Radiomyces spectabilis TaxID=64574 RepID=UPI00221EF44B|nr:Nuf2 family-domain-containing protein [Radiomyces spectabilis]KAI8377950.1 Nuf2 family-domain-containing protein [Radiomyces spectabilis]